MTAIQKTPPETWLHVLSFARTPDLLSVALVDSFFHDLAQETLFKNILDLPALSLRLFLNTVVQSPRLARMVHSFFVLQMDTTDNTLSLMLLDHEPWHVPQGTLISLRRMSLYNLPLTSAISQLCMDNPFLEFLTLSGPASGRDEFRLPAAALPRLRATMGSLEISALLVPQRPVYSAVLLFQPGVQEWARFLPHLSLSTSPITSLSLFRAPCADLLNIMYGISELLPHISLLEIVLDIAWDNSPFPDICPVLPRLKNLKNLFVRLLHPTMPPWSEMSRDTVLGIMFRDQPPESVVDAWCDALPGLEVSLPVSHQEHKLAFPDLYS